MLRYQVFLSRLIIGLILWYAIVVHNGWSLLSGGGGPSQWTVVTVIVLYAPLWGILSLGFYAIFNIAMGVKNVRDVPEAAMELEQQILEAKQEMKKRGILLETTVATTTTATTSISVDAKKNS